MESETSQPLELSPASPKHSVDEKIASRQESMELPSTLPKEKNSFGADIYRYNDEMRASCSIEASGTLRVALHSLCSFGNMRNLEVNESGTSRLGIKNHTFYRSGEIGDSKKY
ncbi:hypothetical protein AgCh_020428 [Apium graveolens]